MVSLPKKKNEPYLLSLITNSSRDEEQCVEEIDKAIKELDLAMSGDYSDPDSRSRKGSSPASPNTRGRSLSGPRSRNGSKSELPNLKDGSSHAVFKSRKGSSPSGAVTPGGLPDNRPSDDSPSYLVEHLATFGVGAQYGVRLPEDGLRRLQQMERSSAIWAQRMVLRLRRDVISVEDENGVIVEQFPLRQVSDPTAFISHDPHDVYNNLLVFIVNEDRRRSNTPTEMHIFQIKMVAANEVAEDIRLYLDGRFSQVAPGMHDTGFEIVHREPQPAYPAPRPPKSWSPSRDQDHRLTRAESSYSARDEYTAASASPDYFERDVNTLNRCFDDIERFVARIQAAALAQRDLDMMTRQKTMGNRRSRQHPQESMLRSRAELPSKSDFIAIFQKFRLCFNLLAKLKSHIHEPNAPELLHFLFTPLVLIVDSCRWGHGGNIPQNVTAPPLTREAKEFLINCLTSKEMEVWMSLGEAWRTPGPDLPNAVPNSYTPSFDGLPPSVRSSPPVNGNGVDPATKQLMLERERLAMKEEALRERERMIEEERRSLHEMKRQLDEERRSVVSDHPPHFEEEPLPPRQMSRSMADIRMGQRGVERDIPITLSSSLGDSPGQRSFLDDLRLRRGRAVQVTYDRVGQNSKELTVKKGEYLEVLNDTRKWWECRNASGRVGFVPNTIVTIVDASTVRPYQNGGPRSSYEQPLFVRPGGSNSGPPSATYVHQERNGYTNGGAGSTSPHGNPYAPGGPDTPDYLQKRIGRKGEFRYF